MNLNCCEKIRSHKFYPIMLEAEQIIAKRFPFGAINQVDVKNRTEISDLEFNQYFTNIDLLVQEFNASGSKNIPKMADISQTILSGNCSLFANYCMGYLKPKHPEVSFEVIILGTDHVALLIGRPTNAAPDDISTWGEDTVICDVWARECYFATEINKKFQNINFLSRVLNDDGSISIIPNKDHYLDGNAELLIGKANDAFTNMIVAWVKEDQKRFQRPNPKAPKAPKIPNAIKASYSQTTLTNLSLISKFSGWKFNNHQSSAWLVCNNAKQAKRIVKTLQATKAMVVESSKDKKTGNIIVRCGHFQEKDLKNLAKPLSAQSLDSSLFLAHKN